MCPPSPPVEPPPASVVARAEPRVPRLEPVAVAAGIGTFAALLIGGWLLYLAEFQVAGAVVQVFGWGGVAAAIVAFKLSRPSSSLTPTERMVRERRRVYVLIGMLGAAAVLGSIVTATQLKTWQDWMRLAFTALSPVGFFLLIRTRFSIG